MSPGSLSRAKYRASPHLERGAPPFDALKRRSTCRHRKSRTLQAQNHNHNHNHHDQNHHDHHSQPRTWPRTYPARSADWSTPICGSEKPSAPWISGASTEKETRETAQRPEAREAARKTASVAAGSGAAAAEQATAEA